MVSPELLRRFPFFAGFSPDQLTTLAKASDELTVEQGHLFFYEGDAISSLYLVLEGSVAIALNMPEKGSRSIIPPPAAKAREVVISVVRPSEVFAWSALVPPYKATSSARAEESSRVVSIDCRALRETFQQDTAFGYQMLLRVAQIARDRIQDLHYETLANSVDEVGGA